MKKYYRTHQIPEDIFFSPSLNEKMIDKYITNLPLITIFCKKAGLSVVSIDSINEKGYNELLCIFNDNLGGYTMQGIRDSIGA